MGLRSEGDVVRGQRDVTGFVVTADQAEDVISTAIRLEQDAIGERDQRLGLSPEHGFIGGVCPHDDHLYAARAYVHLTERITAPRVVLIGVFHAARLWNLENVLVFDDFENWHGPWGPVTVDPLREKILSGLGESSFVIDNAMHCREHSLAAKTGLDNPEGHFLRYATSLSEPQLPVSQKTLDSGLGTTAPSNLHHWVGYATVGFTSDVKR